MNFDEFVRTTRTFNYDHYTTIPLEFKDFNNKINKNLHT